MALNAKTVSTLPATGRDRTVYFDLGKGGVPGLCVRVTTLGHRSYWFRYECQGAKHWLPLGDVTEVGLADARERAHALRAHVGKARRGETSFPHDEVRQARQTAAAAETSFERVAQSWLGSTEFDLLRPDTRREYGRVTRTLLVPAFGRLNPNELRREDVAAFLFDLRDGTRGRQRRFMLSVVTKDRGPAGVLANRVRAVLGSLFRWATAEEQRSRYGVTANPLLGLARVYSEPEPKPRVYSPNELRRIFAAAADIEELRHLVPLIAFTLTRSNEARGARWMEFDLERALWTVPAERSKDRRPHMVPLNQGSVAVLNDLHAAQRAIEINAGTSGPLFPADTKAAYVDQPQDSITSLRRASGVSDFNLHPLRDTAAHWLIEELRVRGDVVEDLLSHTPTRLERTYRGERRTSLAEMREALNSWSDTLAAILGDAGKRYRQRRRGKKRSASLSLQAL